MPWIKSGSYAKLVFGFALNYNENGGTPEQTDLTGQTKLPDPLPTLTRTGYEFDKWYTNSGCTTAATAGAKITANTTLYAKWTPHEYTVNYDANAGSDTVTGMPTNNKQVVKYDDSSSVTAPKLTRTGYDFLGWATAANPTQTTDVTYSPEATVHAKNGAYIFPSGSSGLYDLSTKTGGSTTLYAVWKGNVAYLDEDVEDEINADNDTELANFYPSLADAAESASDNTITLFGKPKEKKTDVKIPKDVTVKVDIADVPKVEFATAEESDFDYDTDGTLTFNWGSLKILAESTLNVNDSKNSHKVELKPDESTQKPVFTKAQTTGSVTITEANSADDTLGGDTVIIDDVEYTPKNGETISVLTPHEPFPGASGVTIPKDIAATVDIGGNGSPTLSVTHTRSGDVTLERGTDGIFPATVKVATSGDKVTVDPDGAGETSGTEYTTTAANTEVEVASNGAVTLKKGGVELDADEGLYFENTSGVKKVAVKIPAGSKTATAKAEIVDGQLTYTVELPKAGKIDIGGTEYTVPANKTAKLSVTVDDDGKAKISLTSGTVELDGNEEIYVDDVIMKNSTGETLSVTDNNENDGDDGKFDVTVGADSFTYASDKDAEKKNLEVKKVKKDDDSEALQFVLDTADESIAFSGKKTQNTEFADANNNVLVSVDKDSEGDVTVKKTETGFEAKIENGKNETSEVKVGECEYGIPEGTTVLSTKTDTDGDGKVYGSLTKGTAEVPGNGGIIFVDDVKVTDNTNNIVPVTDNEDDETKENSGADDGHFTLKSGEDVFTYIASTESTDKNDYDKTLIVRENGDNLQLVLDAANESVELSGTKSRDIEFTSDNNDVSKVFVKVDKNSEGDISVTKGSFTVNVDNTGKEKSIVQVGTYTYTVPAGEKAMLKLESESDDPTETAKLYSGTVELNGADDGEKVIVNGVTISNTTGVDMTVTKTSDTVTTLTINGKTYTYTKASAGTANDLTVTTVSDVLQFTLNEAGETVSYAGKTTADVEFTDGSNCTVKVAAASTGTLTVQKTAGGFTTNVANGTGGTSVVTTGGTTYTVPKNTETILTTPTAGTTATMTKGIVTMPTDGKVIANGITVTNSTGKDMTVKLNDNGTLDITVEGNTLNYSKGEASAASVTFTAALNGNTVTAITALLTTKNEKLTVLAEKVNVDVNVISTADGGNVVTVFKTSKGDVVIENKSYDVTVTNEAGETSQVKVGKDTYTVPEKTTTVLSAAAATETAKLLSGTAELDKDVTGSENGESLVVPTATPYTVTNASSADGGIITITASVESDKVTGAKIAVPSGNAFEITKSGGGKEKYVATGTLTSVYVTDGSGNVKLGDAPANPTDGEGETGIALKLDTGNVTLKDGQSIYANTPGGATGVLISNPASAADGGIVVDAGDGSVDTTIALKENEIIAIGGTLKNSVITGASEYTSAANGTVLALDKTNSCYDDGTTLLQSGAIKLDAVDDAIGITGASSYYVIDVPEGKPTVTVTKGTDAGTCTIEIPEGGEVIIAADSKLYTYVNHSAAAVTVSIKADGTLKTVLNATGISADLPTGSYEGYAQSVLVSDSDNITRYIFEDDLDLLLSKAYLDALSGDDANKHNADKTVQNTVVLNTAVNPTTTGYVLTQNCIDIYTAQGNLAKNGKHGDVTAYTEVGSVTPALYTVDSRERSQQYVGDQSIANDVTSCMVVKISNETNENGHVEVQAGEAKIKWSETDTTYYVTLADALYDAANVVDTSLNQYNKHNGKGSAQTIVMNINPYGDREGMTLEEGDKLIVRGEDVSKEGDSFTAITDATLSMYTAKKNNVYLTAGTVRADNATAEGETANGVKVYVNTDDTYYATSDKSIVVTGGKTGEATKFADLRTAAGVMTTAAGQTVTVGIGGSDKVDFTAASKNVLYPVCRAGKLDNVGDKVTVKGANTADYTVYSLVDHAEKYTDAIDKYTKVVDLGTNADDMTITNGSGVTSITTAGALSEVTVPKDSKLTVTVGANVYSYVNDSNGPVSMSLTGTGATMNTELNESTAPTNLPKGTYDAYVIKTDGNTTTYTFQNGMDAIFAKAALENGEVHTVVINTDLETIPSTTTYIHTKNGYDIYGVEGKLTESGRADTKYTGISEVKTVDARERTAFHALDDEYIASLAACMMVKVENGKVFVEASEARIQWSETDTSYYLTLADALYDAAHDTDATQYNTHDGAGKSQTIIMNTNPYDDRENMAMENGDVLMTCGENVYNAGDKYTAVKNAVITMFKSHNDVYLTSGLLQADANEADATDKTVTVYVNTEDSGYYASSEQRVLVTAGKTADADTFAELSAVARVATTEANQSVTVGIGGTDTAIFTAVLGDTSYPICRIGHLYRAGDTVNVDGENVQNYTVYSLLRVYDKNYKPLEPKYEYAKIFVPAANTGDTSIVNGVEQNKRGTVRVNSAVANDKFVLWMPQEPTHVTYSVSEENTTAVFSAPHTLTLASGGYHFIGDCTFKINGVDFKGKDAATGYTVAHRSGVDIVDICDEVYGVRAGKTVYVSYNEAKRTVKYGDKTYTSTNSSAAVMIPGKTANVDPAGGSDIYADYRDQTHCHFYVSGPVFSGHAIKIDETDNGTVTANPRTAMAGTVVTLTVKADEGYKLKSLRVLDFNGNEVKLSNLGNGKYSFTMPGSSVTVKAEFALEGETVGFVDVPADAYYADAVAWAAENGITNGVDAVHFGPEIGVTRAQVVTFLWRAAGSPEPVGDASKFVDVPANEYYVKAVAWAIEQGITKGTSDTAFSPDMVCTRGQIVTFLARFAGVEDTETESVFADVPANEFFAAAVKWAKDNGVTSGVTDTTFEPYTNCNRAQVVTFLYRWMVK